MFYVQAKLAYIAAEAALKAPGASADDRSAAQAKLAELEATLRQLGVPRAADGSPLWIEV